MAPWPELGTEPKAPDRTKTAENRAGENLKSKSEPPEDKKPSPASIKDDAQGEAKKKDVHSLDDGQLKALLDEAIQYKCPKDREGKSKIFRELLQKVEADESECGYPVVGLRGSCARRALRSTACASKSVAVSERATRGGSLQNIFVAAGEFDGHHTGGARRKTKQRPGSSVSARQREGGSLPCNVNAGWPVEPWQSVQSDQVRRKGLFERDQGGAAATQATQARRQTLMHSASNELPAGGVHSAGELYPLRRHHSSSDQSRAERAGEATKHKSHSESSTGRRMPQVTKPEYTSLDMGGLDLEMKTFSRVHCPPSDRYRYVNFVISGGGEVTSCPGGARLTASDVESESEHGGGGGEVYTTRASLEVEPVDSTFELDLHHVEPKPLVNMKLSDVDCVELNENYTSVQSVVSDHCDGSVAAGTHHQHSTRHHTVYKTMNTMNTVSTISLVNISAKPEPGCRQGLQAIQAIQGSQGIQGVDENGNPSQALQGSRGPVSGTAASATKKNHHKRKQLSEKNVVLSVSQNIAGYRGDKDLETVLSFIESDKTKSGGKPSLKKTGGVLVGSLSSSSSTTKSKKQHKTIAKIAMTKCSSLEEISQRNLSDLTESAESERSVVVRKPRSTEDTSRERRSWGDQVYIRSESQNDISMELEAAGENNSDSEFQMVTKKQRKRKSGGDSGGKRGRNHRPARRSPRRKSTSSVPPSERSGDSDVDSVHSLPVGGQPAVISYAHIAAGVAAAFDKSTDIEEWCNSVTQHLAPLTSTSEESDPDKCDNNNKKRPNSVGGEESSGGNKVVEVPVIDRRRPADTMTAAVHTVHTVSAANPLPAVSAVPTVNSINTASPAVQTVNTVNTSTPTFHTVNAVNTASPAVQTVNAVNAVNSVHAVYAAPSPGRKHWRVSAPGAGTPAPVERKRHNLNREEFPSLPTKNGGWRREEKVPGTKPGREARSKSAGRSVVPPAAALAAAAAAHRPAVILLQDEVGAAARDSSVCEITFGFEVNQLLLSADERAQVMVKPQLVGNAEPEALDGEETCSSSSSEMNFQKNNMARASSVTATGKGEITNSTVQELFKRHETLSNMASIAKARRPDISDIADAYIPPKAPVLFNHDKIVNFVGLAWEDIMRQGKIQYYTADN